MVIERIRTGGLTLVSSPDLIAEFAEVLDRPKFQAILARSGAAADRLLEELSQLAEVIDPPPLTAPVCRDPDDDAVLALAVAARADVIVSGDADLLTLGSYENVPIVNAVACLALIDS
jgi:putative PIN family toxin of toxin-antitoxin system